MSHAEIDERRDCVYPCAMLLKRQKTLLALLGAHGGELSHLDFQKLLFLYCQESNDQPEYEFMPYRFGGFSFTSHADMRALIERGLLLSPDDDTWRLTPQGIKAGDIPTPVRRRIDGFARRHAHLRGDALVAHAYRRYPYYAARSEIASRVLAGDDAALAAIAAQRPAPSETGLLTIGYEGKTLEGYFNRLLKTGVTILCDVRRNPLSRKFGFSKKTLSRTCQNIGIRYEHLPELGIASEDRRELKTQSDYDALFAAYERDWLPKQTGSLDAIRAWIDTGKCVALTCFEALPQQCHRHCVSDILERKFGPQFHAKHL
jgi:hypothetical protein